MLYKATSEEFYQFLADMKALHDVKYKRVGDEDWYVLENENKTIAKVSTVKYNRQKRYWVAKQVC